MLRSLPEQGPAESRWPGPGSEPERWITHLMQNDAPEICSFVGTTRWPLQSFAAFKIFWAYSSACSVAQKVFSRMSSARAIKRLVIWKGKQCGASDLRGGFGR